MIKIFSDEKCDIEDLKSLYMLSDDLICTAGADGYFKRINPAFLKVLGYSYEELLSKPIVEFLIPEIGHDSVDAIKRVASGEVVTNYENCYRRKDGTPVFISWSARAKDGVIYGIGRDISLLKEAQKKLDDHQKNVLMDSARLSTLGELALGIGHEIKNPLSIINFISQRLKKMAFDNKLDSESAAKFSVQIDKAVTRIDNIVRGLKTLARNSEADPFIETNLSSVIEEMVDVCADQFKMNEVRLEVEELKETMINCRSSQIAQVILNLLCNSCDAVKDLEEKWVKIHFSEDCRFHYIHITDSGSGIPVHLHNTIFDTFYTSKAIGEGTGLGLPISKKIIEAHGGKLFVDTNCAHTRFTFSIAKACRAFNAA